LSEIPDLLEPRLPLVEEVRSLLKPPDRRRADNRPLDRCVHDTDAVTMEQIKMNREILEVRYKLFPEPMGRAVVG